MPKISASGRVFLTITAHSCRRGRASGLLQVGKRAFGLLAGISKLERPRGKGEALAVQVKRKGKGKAAP